MIFTFVARDENEHVITTPLLLLTMEEEVEDVVPSMN
jgi:hypothetical protein